MSGGLSVSLLLWIAFAVLVAVVLWILLAACGLAWPDGRPMLVFCPAVAGRQADPALGAEQERRRALERSVRDLEIALLERPYCAPSEPSSIEDAIRHGDEQALAGCWVLSSDYTLYDINTGEPRSVRDWEVCFSNGGAGSQTLSLTNGIQCDGQVNANFPDEDTLSIRDMGDMSCRGGDWQFVRARVITCTLGSDGSAQCLTRDAGGSDAGGSMVTIRRKG